LGERARISNGFEKTDLPRPNAGVFREIDPETNNGTSHMNSSSYAAIIFEEELMEIIRPSCLYPIGILRFTL
jgi:hypothetical protein